jgi:putative restriction endonuclease
MAAGKKWTRDELLMALHLYERIPFGQQDRKNQEVIALAASLKRTPSSVAMKLNNMTSIDPEEKARGVSGLSGASELDRAVWKEFHESPEVVEEAEQLWLQKSAEPESKLADEKALDLVWKGATDAEAVRRVRLAQTYFSRVVLANFDGKCALTGNPVRQMLTASHIVGWAEDPEHRVDPRNGLCLNRLHDSAFDKKLITFDEELRLAVGKKLRSKLPREPLSEGFLHYEGQRLRNPVKHEVGLALMERHRRAFRVSERA